jgi:hypothetical protein
MEICYNCGATVEKCGRDAEGRPICCIYCAFNPLGCRCKYGEFGVAQDYASYDPGDEDYEEDDWDDE